MRAVGGVYWEILLETLEPDPVLQLFFHTGLGFYFVSGARAKKSIHLPRLEREVGTHSINGP